MREKLETYVDFLFAGAPKTAQMEGTKAEILQNTLDKFDDLLAQGKTPEAAYSLAVAGIGDVSELLTGETVSTAPQELAYSRKERERVDMKRAVMRAVAILMYITCVLPPILLDDTWAEDALAPALMFVMIAIATALMVLQDSMKRWGTASTETAVAEKNRYSPWQELRRIITAAVMVLGMAVYFIVSFTTGAWHITWVIFPISGVVAALIRAIMDLKEEEK